MQFNELFREYRMMHGTVRQFAKEHGYDVAYISRLENGIITPPKDNDKLEKFATCLGLKKGTDRWQEFFDLAAVAKNELPADLQDNERVAKILPAFYRTLRNKRLDEDDVEKLLELIKKSGKGEAE